MDRRERGQWYHHFDEKRMVLVLEDVEQADGELADLEIPAKYEVCGTCEGKGHHVNPSIDIHGLTGEDFEDDDFREGYFNGRYDVACNECGGARVSPVVDEARATAEQIQAAHDKQDGDADYAAACAAERVDTPDHIQAAADVLSTASEGGSNYWCSFKRSGTTLDAAGNVTALAWVEDQASSGEEPKRGVMTPAKLLAAAPLALADPKLQNDYARGAIADLIFRPADIDYDASVADLLFQYAAFGEVVYG